MKVRTLNDIAFIMLLIIPVFWSLVGYDITYFPVVIALMAIAPVLFIAFLLMSLRSKAVRRWDIDTQAYMYLIIYIVITVLIALGVGNISPYYRIILLSEGLVLALIMFSLTVKITAIVHNVTKLSSLITKSLVYSLPLILAFIVAYVTYGVLKLGYWISTMIIVVLILLIIPLIFIGFLKGKT